MKIEEIFQSKKQILSFEVFPPKKTSSIETIYDTLEQLKELNPDYISVTYGAGGLGRNNLTSQIASDIKNRFGIESVAHLTCINYSHEEIKEILVDFKERGIENILALRGDINPELEPKKDFLYANELISFIKENGDFHVAGACYPEVHLEAKSAEEDMINLKKKVDAGAKHLTSQLFFDNKVFYEFVKKARQNGITVPIQAGIMPVMKKEQIERMVSMCGAGIPDKLSKILEKYGDDPQALLDAGIAYAVDQIVDLLANNVDGIHLYTMNNPVVAKRIVTAIKHLL